ncbi:uncharacterized protein BDR25DRAFT_245067 [Lindgomyces ingoldianus]|uniref:Uncharacterized protein n=1 Tax=Lindgomyces ingoldianus TaxID=673940 RepID=A0ACB6Q9U8_9PLEO|nr:uncharacterized protein BDR25DRAFT_245067 [Lindgomyces ingoldianus]KAF2463729.1 hypothetical protein BDR25DRAFT_245067 [Lindgomyces ingoldianus]
MRSLRYLLLCSALVFCLDAAAIQDPVVARQNGSPSSQPSASPTPSKAESSQALSAATSSINSSVKESQTARPSEQASQASSNAAASSSHSLPPSTVIQAPVITASNEPSPSNAGAAKSMNPLPIQPKITPAMGVTGAILLISGLVYTVIGIKNKWLYIFFSSAYLTSLSVTVLIVYLMSPPVTDAVQGAFFVAAFFSGLIFGALSLVFSDITDGLGCMLGGFCLSMWFLTLKEGGLIASTTGRAIFIGAMSFAGFSLSFSHYTRTYGLIFSISFSGATITVLGIDCLSRAGWKEFWLYLWGLNSNTFPLNTNTYPITKALRVEIACVILICAFGLVSQLRLWKLVKERREKSAAARLEQTQNLEREEEELGRKIEDDFTRERAQWEATYGDKSLQQASLVDSSNSSFPKTSTSIRENRHSGSDSVEMVDLSTQPSGIKTSVSRPSSKQVAVGSSVTVTVLQDDEIQEIDAEGNPIPLKKRDSKRHSGMTATPNSARGSVEIKSAGLGLPRTASTRSSLQSSVPPPPVVVPLPFTTPKEEDDQSQDSDNTSTSALPESTTEPLQNVRLSKRFSTTSARKRISTGRYSDNSESREALIIPHIEDDRASSVAATLDDDDDDVSLSEYSGSQWPSESKLVEQTSHPAVSAQDEIQSPVEEQAGHSAEQVEARDVATPIGIASRQSLTVSTDPQPGANRVKRESLSSRRRRSGTSKKSGSPSGSSQTESHVGSLKKGALPDKLSKVALSYRTNEWAKHLDAAEKPDLDELPEPESPGVAIEHGFKEAAAPVNAELVKPQPQPQPITYTNSKRGSTGGIPRSTSQPKLRTLRNTSTPLLSQTLVESPIEEMAGTNPNPIVSSMPSNTLMGQRESLVKNRITSQPLAPYASAPNLRMRAMNQENMTLAQRKQLIQSQKPPSASQPRRQSGWAVGGQSQAFDSHQPKRESGIDQGRREAMLASWRESMRQDTAPIQAVAISEEARRAAMINDIRQKEMEKQQQTVAETYRDAMVGNMMRSGEMMDAHREAMRRLQANANRQA